MKDHPFSLDLGSDLSVTGSGPYDSHLVRKLSDLRGYFADQQAFEELLHREDPVIYEVLEIRRPEVSGELLSGLSIVHPGQVGDEYNMTKGHFHSVRETAEIYYGLKGHGLLLMENEAGEWAAEEVVPGRIVYVPPCWAHRSVNLALKEDLITFFVYPGHAGHDYGSIASSGFRKLALHVDGGYKVVDNPAWKPPAGPG